MKYNDRVIHQQAFERQRHEEYTRFARSQGLDLTAWINKLCARACKPDARQINKRDRKAARRGE